MLVILASARDPVAASLAALWESRGAVLLTPADLSVAGWCYRLPPADPADPGALVAGGSRRAAAEVHAVLSRLPAIAPDDLEHIAAQDLGYVAAEMTAFLRAWLHSLPCPVWNRPAADGLCGPDWRLARWIHLAARLGIPVAPAVVDTTAAIPPPADSATQVTVAGERCFGAPDAATARQARTLAAAAGADLLGVRFTATRPARLCGVTVLPDLSDPEIAGAVLDGLAGGAVC